MNLPLWTVTVKDVRLVWTGGHFYFFLPFIYWQLPIIFEPRYGWSEGDVMFDSTFEHGTQSSLHHLVLGLLQDTGGLWSRETRTRRRLW